MTGQLRWQKNNVVTYSGADDAACSKSPIVYGDLVFADDDVYDKRTGELMWSFSGSDNYQFCKVHTFQGRTYWVARTYPYVLRELATGAQTDVEGGKRYSIAGGTSYYGEDKAWEGRTIRTVAPKSVSTATQVSGWKTAENYFQPIVVNDHGYYLTGGHCAGGTVNCVNLQDSRWVWGAGGAGTMIGVGDKVLCHGSGNVYVLQAGLDERVLAGASFRYDASVNNYTLPAYWNQHIYIIAGQGLTCLYVGLAAPVLTEIGDATWSPATASAEVKAELINTGGSAVNAYVSWGLTDGGSDPGDWEHTTAVGPCSVGGISGHAERIEQQQGLLVPVLGHERYGHGLVQTGRATGLDVCGVHRGRARREPGAALAAG